MKNLDVGLIIALAMLIAWAFITFVVNDAPGPTHALLTGGIALLIWRIVKRGDVSAGMRGQSGSPG